MEVLDGRDNLDIYPVQRREIAYYHSDHSWDEDWTVYSNWLVDSVYMREGVAWYPSCICIEITNPEEV